MTHVVVFDTNVLLSGIVFRGVPYQCLELARLHNIEAVTCQEILDELQRILGTKFKFSNEQATEAIVDIISFSQIVNITNGLHVIAFDPDDDKVIECAVVGAATHIVTGDRRHILPIGTYQGISIMSPQDFLRSLPKLSTDQSGSDQ